MTSWVALLRGVNVGGVTVRSAELAEAVRSLGFEQVRTVLATGNVLLDGPTDGAAVAGSLTAGISERFGYDARLVLLPRADVARIVEGYPFQEDPEHHAYIVFGMDASVIEDLAAAADPATDQVAVGPPAGDGWDGGVLYWRCPKGDTIASAFGKQLTRAKFRASTTNRNLNTVRRLL